MNQTSLYMIEIRCQKMLHRVGQSTFSPYQVTVSRGARLGFTGQVMSGEVPDASNLAIEPGCAQSDRSWLVRGWIKLLR